MAPRVRVYLATPEDEEALQNLARAEEFIRAFFQYLVSAQSVDCLAKA